jgi:polysaccharide biosynthesis/export protein
VVLASLALIQGFFTLPYMSRSYVGWSLVAAVLPFVSVSHGQSLEDKVSQARQLQAQSMMGVDQATLDSLVQVKKNQASGRKGAEKSRLSDKAIEEAILDSLIAGPQQLDSLESDFDALSDPSDTTKVGKKKKKRLARRYEQRIFQSIDKSAFSSSTGAVGREYILGPNDGVTVSLWGDKEKEYPLTLNSEGTIFLEGVGQIPLAGLNVGEAEKRVRERLSRIYSGINRGTTNVNLTVGRVGPKKVFVLGEVKKPGGYVFTGHTSILTTLYFAEGPTDIGTVRNLVLNRGGKKYPLDLYDYLLRGETLKPDVVQDGDIVFAARAEILVEVSGDVGRPAIYEMKKTEGLKELLAYAGGLNATAANQKMTLQRVFEDGKSDYIDLPPPQEFLTGKAKFALHDGDKVLVEKSTEPTRNYFTITGPVKYPGTYQSEGIASVTQLIQRAGGLREDAFLGRVHVVRFHPDGSSELFAYAVQETSPDSIRLEPKDNVILYSVKDMFLPDSVEIAGSVFNPGKYEFRKGMTVKDLVMQAGGFLPEHESGKALVFRGDAHERKVSQVEVSMDIGLDKDEKSLDLQPYDVVHIPMDPRWYRKEVVTLNGLIKRPGKYALLYPGEKLASVVERAGGFKEGAYVEGARFFRQKDSIGRVGVDLAYAMKHPKKKSNISMVGGDSLYVPEVSSTVKVMGEVGFETSVLYREGASTSYYIEHAGGFTRRSEKGRVVVQYANGETSSEGTFNRKPDAGSVIYVPQGPEPKPIEWLTATTALLQAATLAFALLITVQSLK